MYILLFSAHPTDFISSQIITVLWSQTNLYSRKSNHLTHQGRKERVPTQEIPVRLLKGKWRWQTQMAAPALTGYWIDAPPNSKQKIIQDDIDHEPNIYNFRGITRMPASALGCLCVMQVWGQSISPLSKERRLREQGCFPLEKWLYAFQGSLYLSLTNIRGHDGLEVLARFFSYQSMERRLETVDGVAQNWWYHRTLVLYKMVDTSWWPIAQA